MSKSRRDRAFKRAMRKHKMAPKDLFDGQLSLPQKLWPKTILSRSQGRHWKVVLEFLGQKKIFIMAKSPSDHRSFLNRKADIRRWVKSVAEQHRRLRPPPARVPGRGR